MWERHWGKRRGDSKMKGTESERQDKKRKEKEHNGRKEFD